jgi:hypothetical protein
MTKRKENYRMSLKEVNKLHKCLGRISVIRGQDFQGRQAS